MLTKDWTKTIIATNHFTGQILPNRDILAKMAGLSLIKKAGLTAFGLASGGAAGKINHEINFIL